MKTPDEAVCQVVNTQFTCAGEQAGGCPWSLSLAHPRFGVWGVGGRQDSLGKCHCLVLLFCFHPLLGSVLITGRFCFYFARFTQFPQAPSKLLGDHSPEKSKLWRFLETVILCLPAAVPCTPVCTHAPGFEKHPAAHPPRNTQKG